MRINYLIIVGNKLPTDLEMMQTEGYGATKQVDANMVIKKKRW